MRGRTRTPKHFVQNPRQTPLLFREAFGVRARPRAALDLWRSYSGADGAQITFDRSHN
jgi:hypothetical protein